MDGCGADCPELAVALERAGISANGGRLTMLTQRAQVDGTLGERSHSQRRQGRMVPRRRSSVATTLPAWGGILRPGALFVICATGAAG